MNEPLRQALLRARLRENDVAAQLGVDPKTVRRWLNGRVPHPHNRASIAELVGADEGDLWPEAGGPLAARTRPEELGTVYPHRWAVPREVWVRLFGSAKREIAILAYSALFLAEDTGILRILADKGRAGVTVRIALGRPGRAERRRTRRGRRHRRRHGRQDPQRAHAVPAALAQWRTSRSGCTVPCCTTRSTEATTSSWSISTHTASRPRRHPCSA